MLKILDTKNFIKINIIIKQIFCMFLENAFKFVTYFFFLHFVIIRLNFVKFFLNFNI